MRALHRIWLIGLSLAMATAACGDDDDVAAGDPETQAAEALSRAMHFTGAELRDGAMGIATEDQVEVLLASEQVVHPGEAGLMPLEVDNPIADDKAEQAVLMQFGDVDQHVRVATKKSVNGPGDLNFEFSLDDAVCNGLCATTIEVGVTLALELEGGDIGKHEKTSIKVDCSKKGSKAACNSGASGKGGSGGARDGGVDTGSGSSGRDGSVPISAGATAAVQDLLDAVDDFDSEICACIPGADGTTCVDTSASQRPCNEAVLSAFAEGNEDLLDCTRQFFADQQGCIADAACDSTKLEACTAASTAMGGNNWAAIEAECGTVPAGLRSGIDACGGGAPNSSCLDSTPINSDQFCDGTTDCPDGSDEMGCDSGNPGTPTSFPCGSSTLPLEQVCDGTMDCPGGLDEMVCAPCSDGSGMFSSFTLCDGKNQCADGSDEMGCMYPCVGGGMVMIQLVCNGTPDCADGSDESFCNGNNFTCPSGLQIPITAVCDGTSDCPDGGDEAQALCGSM